MPRDTCPGTWRSGGAGPGQHDGPRSPRRQQRGVRLPPSPGRITADCRYDGIILPSGRAQCLPQPTATKIWHFALHLSSPKGASGPASTTTPLSVNRPPELALTPGHAARARSDLRADHHQAGHRRLRGRAGYFRVRQPGTMVRSPLMGPISLDGTVVGSRPEPGVVGEAEYQRCRAATRCVRRTSRTASGGGRKPASRVTDRAVRRLPPIRLPPPGARTALSPPRAACDR